MPLRCFTGFIQRQHGHLHLLGFGDGFVVGGGLCHHFFYREGLGALRGAAATHGVASLPLVAAATVSAAGRLFTRVSTAVLHGRFFRLCRFGGRAGGLCRFRTGCGLLLRRGGVVGGFLPVSLLGGRASLPAGVPLLGGLGGRLLRLAAFVLIALRTAVTLPVATAAAAAPATTVAIAPVLAGTAALWLFFFLLLLFRLGDRAEQGLEQAGEQTGLF